MGDGNPGINWSFPKGGITSPEQRDRQEMEFLAFALGAIIDDYNASGALRFRDTLPLLMSTELARLLQRLLCFQFGAFGNRKCAAWKSDVIENGAFQPWETNCKICPKPFATREKVCAVLFPGQPANKPNADSYVPQDRFKVWISGREAMPIRMARNANASFEQRGWKTPQEAEFMRQLLDVLDGLHKDLRPLKRMLLRNWKGLLARQQAAAVTWRPGGLGPSWRFLPVDPDEDLRPVAPGIYPSAEGMETFDAAGSYSFDREVRSFQRKPMTYQIRLTQYPLPIDETAEEQAEGWAVRLLVRPLGL